MQEILAAMGPLTIANVASLMVFIWGPGLAIAAVVFYRFYQERNVLPPELAVVVIGMFSAMCFLPLMAVWQSFEALSVETWAKLTGAELAMTLLIITVARQALKGEKTRAPQHFAAEWKRRRNVWAIVLPLIGLLFTVMSTRNFIAYMMADPATATMIAVKYSAGGHKLLIDAEWSAQDGKKIPVVLTFDQLDAFRPKLSPGLELPFRLNAAEATAGKIEPLYSVDTGVIVELLGYLSTIVFSLSALGAGLMMRREKKA